MNLEWLIKKDKQSSFFRYCMASEVLLASTLHER